MRVKELNIDIVIRVDGLSQKPKKETGKIIGKKEPEEGGLISAPGQGET